MISQSDLLGGKRMKDLFGKIKVKLQRYMINPYNIKKDMIEFISDNSPNIIKTLIIVTIIAVILFFCILVTYALVQSVHVIYIPKGE